MSVRYFAEHDATIWHGSALDVLAGMPSGSIDCCVTSPPYYGLRDYGRAGQIGLEESPIAYVDALRAVFAEVRRVLAHDGVLWLNLGDTYSSSTKGSGGTEHASAGSHFAPRRIRVDRPAKNLLGIPWRVAFALQDDGWILRNAVVWNKPNAMPESVTDRLSTRYEHVFLFSKSRRYYFDLDAIRVPTTTGHASTPATSWREGALLHAGRTGILHAGWSPEDSPNGRNPGDVWTVATQPYSGAHFATMPGSLASLCILAGCRRGGTVLDPFAGSGTTLMAARRLDRRSVGIELNDDYCEIAVERLGDPPFDFDEPAQELDR